MLTKRALNKLTQAVSSRIRQEVSRYNQKLVESVTQEDLYETFCNKVDPEGVRSLLPTWHIIETHYPPVFTELLSCLREDRKLYLLDSPCNYTLHEIVQPEIERLTANLEEFDFDTLLTEQLFEKIYPMLVEAKYIHFESEKHEPTFELTQPVDEEILDSDTEVIDVFEPPYPASGNVAFEDLTEENSYDEGDWE